MKLTEFFDALVEMEPIKLGSKTKTVDVSSMEKNRAFVDKVYSMGHANPMGRGVLFGAQNDDGTVGYTRVELSPMQWGVNINEIHVLEDKTGQGFGDYVLKKITDEADRNGILLSLSAVPLSTQGKKIPKRKLIRFYKKHGFEQEGGGDLMRRAPR